MLAPDVVTRTAFRTLNSVVRPVLSTGLGNPLPIGAGVAVVETTGRSSGLPRRVPLVAMRLGDKVAVSTVRGDSHWFANLEADDAAKVQLGGRFRDARACTSRGPLNVAVLTTD
ncbi:MAG: nitroreductase family deazaflavin-dependent oxidoreductase [Ilumatobacter sp.]|nr:nitroreductase family deazaflavin-dependent oxidoreductase [Ilumatobacter sp.]